MLKITKLSIMLGAAILVQSLSLRADPPQTGNPEEVKAAIIEIYKNFNDSNNRKAYWELPVYSEATSKLIRTWETAPNQKDIISNLEGGDWLCDCQDFDEKKLMPISFTFAPCGLSETYARVVVKLDLGTSEQRDIYLSLHKEQGRWLISDIENEKVGVSFQDQLLKEIEIGH